MPSKIFIIIATYNGLKWLANCLESTKPYSVIIVDNNSTDGTTEYISNNYPNINIIPQKLNRGFGQANNIGISLAYSYGADYVFLLNQDAYLRAGSIDCLVKLMNENKEYGILSPIHLNGTGDRLDANFSHYVNYNCNKDFFSDYVLKNAMHLIYTVPFVNAAGWLISRECVQTVGGFDPLFFHYGEDDNYCQRLNYHGFKIGVAPDAVLFHDRENRSNPEITYGDNLYFREMEKQLKLKYADINKPWDASLDKLMIRRKNAWLKTTLKLDFKSASFFRKEYQLLKNIKSKILISRNLNKLQGLNHLKVEE